MAQRNVCMSCNEQTADTQSDSIAVAQCSVCGKSRLCYMYSDAANTLAQIQISNWSCIEYVEFNRDRFMEVLNEREA